MSPFGVNEIDASGSRTFNPSIEIADIPELETTRNPAEAMDKISNTWISICPIDLLKSYSPLGKHAHSLSGSTTYCEAPGKSLDSSRKGYGRIEMAMPMTYA